MTRVHGEPAAEIFTAAGTLDLWGHSDGAIVSPRISLIVAENHRPGDWVALTFWSCDRIAAEGVLEDARAVQLLTAMRAGAALQCAAGFSRRITLVRTAEGPRLSLIGPRGGLRSQLVIHPEVVEQLTDEVIDAWLAG